VRLVRTFLEIYNPIWVWKYTFPQREHLVRLHSQGRDLRDSSEGVLVSIELQTGRDLMITEILSLCVAFLLSNRWSYKALMTCTATTFGLISRALANTSFRDPEIHLYWACSHCLLHQRLLNYAG